MISAKQDSQYLQMLVITYYLSPAGLQRHRGIVPQPPGPKRNKYCPLNWYPTSGSFNTSCPYRDGLWCTSPLISSDHTEPGQNIPSRSDHAQLINPSPGIFTLLPTAASERCVPSNVPTHHPWSNKARPHKASGVGIDIQLYLQHNFKASLTRQLLQHYTRICKPTY